MPLLRPSLALVLCLISATASPAQTSRPHHPCPAAQTPSEAPLTSRENALQLLNRFTFGPRPGDLEHLLTLGPEAWLDQQLDPDHIPDLNLSKRLADYPTLTLQPAEALSIFPDRQIIKQTAEGARPYPTDPELAAVYQTQVIKYLRSVDKKQNKPDPEAETDPEKQSAQARAREITGQLLALPARDRMPALLRLPVDDRIAFARHIPAEQRPLFLADLTLETASSSSPSAQTSTRPARSSPSSSKRSSSAPSSPSASSSKS